MERLNIGNWCSAFFFFISTSFCFTINVLRIFVLLFNIVLMVILSLQQVFRDGRWNEEDAAVLVPGDIISIKLGDIVPADARLLEGDPLKIDQVGFLLALTFNLSFCFHIYV